MENSNRIALLINRLEQLKNSMIQWNIIVSSKGGCSQCEVLDQQVITPEEASLLIPYLYEHCEKGINCSCQINVEPIKKNDKLIRSKEKIY